MNCFPVTAGPIIQTCGCYASYDECNAARGNYIEHNPTLNVGYCYSSGYLFFYNNDRSSAFYTDAPSCGAGRAQMVAESQDPASVGPCIRIF